MANVETVIKLIEKNGAEWKRVNDQPCMHTFIKDFYINLCLYKVNENNVIAVDVDDVKKGVSDLISKHIKEGDVFYKELFNIYSNSKTSARNIAELQE